MAKHCNVCNHDYPDNLSACPRCAAAKKTRLAGRSEGRTTQLAKDQPRVTQLGKNPSESDVDLGAEPAELVSDEASDEAQALPPAESGFGVTLPQKPGPTESDVAAESLLSEMPDDEPAAEEQPVSEKEVDDLLANLEEEPETASPEEAAEIAEGEEAIAAAEAEEAAETAEAEEATEAEEEEKPAKPAKPRSSVPALAGGTLLGILLGVGGTLGAKAVLGPDEKVKQPNPVSVPQGVSGVAAPGAAQAKPVPTFETFAARIASGDLDEIAGIEDTQANTAKELLALGEYRLLSYIKKTGNKFNTNDPALQKATQDLQKAADQNEPSAFYALAFIKEMGGQLEEARAEYAKAAQKFANDPVQKQRFESAVLRVELKAAALAASHAAQLPLREDGEDRAALLALLLVGLQQPPPPPGQQPAQQPAQPVPQPGQPAPPPGQPAQPAQQPAEADSNEAGYKFWTAVKLSQKGDFDQAIKDLEEARKLHSDRRFTRLRKAQNPLSDPGEEIFLRCCDELKTYWQLEKTLREGGYLTDKNTPAQAIQALAEKAKGGGAQAKELMDKLASAQQNWKESAAKAGELEKQVEKSKSANIKLDSDLKAAQKTIADRQADLTTAKQEVEKLKSDAETHSGSLKKIREQLVAAKLLEPNDKADVGEAVKKAVDVAKSRDPQGTMRRQGEEIAHLSAALRERWQPEEMLPLWLLVLDENRDQTDLVAKATRDAQRVLMDPQAPPTQKGRAEIVLGLALRNTEKFDEARRMLAAGRGVVEREEWQAHADAALKEVSDPAGYFSTQAQGLYDHGLMETALDLLDRGMKVLPAQDRGRLLAQRSMLELDAARAKAKGPVSPTEPLLVAAQRDAEAAVKTGAAEGHFAAGRIAETLGQVDAAITSYRAALAAHGKLDAVGSRYRMALARVLLMPRGARPNPAAAPTKPAEKVGWRDPAPYPAQLLAERKSLVLLLMFGLQPPLHPGEEPGLEEAEKLADEILKAPPGSVPFTAVAQALAVKGRWSQALQVYVEGIRPMLPREYYDGLMYLILNDPRLRRPDSLRIPNPLEAEKHFAAGLNFYFDGDYGNAERSFLLTIENDSQDARFFYFLGLSRLALNRRRDAYADFNQGALLERLNRPASPAVDASLERIQGPTRCIVNEFRQNPDR